MFCLWIWLSDLFHVITKWNRSLIFILLNLLLIFLQDDFRSLLDILFFYSENISKEFWINQFLILWRYFCPFLIKFFPELFDSALNLLYKNWFICGKIFMFINLILKRLKTFLKKTIDVFIWLISVFLWIIKHILD